MFKDCIYHSAIWAPKRYVPSGLFVYHNRYSCCWQIYNQPHCHNCRQIWKTKIFSSNHDPDTQGCQYVVKWGVKYFCSCRCSDSFCLFWRLDRLYLYQKNASDALSKILQWIIENNVIAAASGTPISTSELYETNRATAINNKHNFTATHILSLMNEAIR